MFWFRNKKINFLLLTFNLTPANPTFFQNSGVVYDCVTWNPLYRYDTAEIDKNYRILRDIRGAGEADDHRKVSHEQPFINTLLVT